VLLRDEAHEVGLILAQLPLGELFRLTIVSGKLDDHSVFLYISVLELGKGSVHFCHHHWLAELFPMPGYQRLMGDAGEAAPPMAEIGARE